MQNSKLRVVFLAPFPVRKLYPEQCKFTKPGNEHPASWIVNLVRALPSRREIELHLVTVKSHLDSDCHFSADGAHIHILKGTRNTLQPLTLYEFDRRILVREVKRINPDVVQAFGTEGPFSYAGVTSGYPCVIKVQGIIKKNLEQMRMNFTSLLWWRYYITQLTERYSIQTAKDFIVDNDYVGDAIIGINSSAILKYLPNLIAPVFFDVVQDWSLLKTNILYVGTLKREKGIFDLLDAFRELAKKFDQAKLRLIGEGTPEIKAQIEQYLNENMLFNKVCLLGSLPHSMICREMQDAAFLVHPAHVDFSPNTVYEAMIAGLPVITTKTGGMVYMIEDNVTGLLVETRDPQALSSAMLALYASPEEQQRLGENARQCMHQRFNQDHILDELIGLYKKIITN